MPGDIILFKGSISRTTRMAKSKERQKAIQLRLKGASYSQIKSELGISKSTLSYWLRGFPLPEKRIRELRDWSQIRIEKYRETRRKKREALLRTVYEREEQELIPLSQRDLFIGGLFLYWGEGAKTKPAEISLSNTNPAIIKFFVHWLKKTLGVKPGKVKVKLHLYKNMNISKEVNYWSSLLGIPTTQFKNPYIKNTTSDKITYTNTFRHGTCNIIVGDADLGRKVLMGLEVLKDYVD